MSSTNQAQIVTRRYRIKCSRRGVVILHTELALIRSDHVWSVISVLFRRTCNRAMGSLFFAASATQGGFLAHASRRICVNSTRGDIRRSLARLRGGNPVVSVGVRVCIRRREGWHLAVPQRMCHTGEMCSDPSWKRGLQHKRTCVW